MNKNVRLDGRTAVLSIRSFVEEIRLLRKKTIRSFVEISNSLPTLSKTLFYRPETTDLLLDG